LKLTSLTIGEIPVRPYDYEETGQDGSLRIMAKAILTDSQHDQLKAMQRTGGLYLIIRRGIDENPKLMILEPDCWSQLGMEYKHRLLLVEVSEEDFPGPLTLGSRWLKILRSHLAYNIAIMDILLATLVNKNILTEREVIRIYKEARERSWDDLYEFYRVDDVDEL
jgi:hypothetical protein